MKIHKETISFLKDQIELLKKESFSIIENSKNNPDTIEVLKKSKEKQNIAIDLSAICAVYELFNSID